MKPGNAAYVILFACFCAVFAPSAFSKSARDYSKCENENPGEDNKEKRWECFDEIRATTSGGIGSEPPNQSAAQKNNSPEIVKQVPPEQYKTACSDSGRTYLSRTWNLGDCDNGQVTTDSDNDKADGNRNKTVPSSFHTLVPHRQSYLILREASSINKNPFSPTNGIASYPYDMDPLEAKFQLSFKAGVPISPNFRLWGAYTQQSNWQMLNSRNSSPFRASHYEPELIATYEKEKSSSLKLVNFGLVHQSNGQTGPESRSWNRLYVQGGWEWESHRTVSVLARGWWRIPESILKDDNPDIKSYLGYGDIVVRSEGSGVKSITTVLLRNNLSLNQNRGFVQLDYALPWGKGSAYYWHLQGVLGYGETLIDYNHHQKAIGIGLSFRD